MLNSVVLEFTEPVHLTEEKLRLGEPQPETQVYTFTAAYFMQCCLLSDPTSAYSTAYSIDKLILSFLYTPPRPPLVSHCLTPLKLA